MKLEHYQKNYQNLTTHITHCTMYIDGTEKISTAEVGFPYRPELFYAFMLKNY